MENTTTLHTESHLYQVVQSYFRMMEEKDQLAEGIHQLFKEHREEMIKKIKASTSEELYTHQIYQRMSRVGLNVKQRAFSIGPNSLIKGSHKQLVLVLYYGYKKSTTVHYSRNGYQIKSVLSRTKNESLIPDQELDFYERLFDVTNQHRAETDSIKQLLKHVASHHKLKMKTHAN